MRIGMHGQTSLLELLIGSTLVLLIFVALLNSLQSTYRGGQTQAQFEDRTRASEKALEILTESPGMTAGHKPDWETSTSIDDVNSFGLAETPLVLGEEKLARFKEWADISQHTPGQPQDNYLQVKEKLGLGKYDFSLMLFVREKGNDGRLKIKPVTIKGQADQYSEIGKSWSQMDGEKAPFSAVVLEQPVVVQRGTYENGTKKLDNDAAVLRLTVYAKEQ